LHWDHCSRGWGIFGRCEDQPGSLLGRAIISGYVNPYLST
jgi:hypothetical protein